MAKLKVKEIHKKNYVLRLNEDEAKALRDVLGLVGGDPTETRRGLLEDTYSLLDGALESKCLIPMDLRGKITFEEAVDRAKPQW